MLSAVEWRNRVPVFPSIPRVPGRAPVVPAPTSHTLLLLLTHQYNVHVSVCELGLEACIAFSCRVGGAHTLTRRSWLAHLQLRLRVHDMRVVQLMACTHVMTLMVTITHAGDEVGAARAPHLPQPLQAAHTQRVTNTLSPTMSCHTLQEDDRTGPHRPAHHLSPT